MSDDEIKSICASEIDSAAGYASGELANDRADAMDFYLGEPYGDEVDGRSQFRTREVMETVQNLMPSLMRIFAETENLVVFDPVGPEDEEAAKQESDRVNYNFWKENRGFFNLLTFCQDALLSKTGIFKAWWDEGKTEREEYNNLSALELNQLMNDPGVEREIVDAEMNEDQSVNVVMEATPHGKVRIEPVPPEEFGINRDARSPFAQDARFVYHRTRRAVSDLIAEGYDADIVKNIPSGDDVETEERLARRHLEDESDVMRFGSNESMRMVWITECYVYLDRDGDDISELLKVTLAAGSGSSASGSKLLDIEEIDAIPLFTAPPSVLTHKFYGLSIADLVMDIQRITSTLLRQMLDNTYLANNSRLHVNQNVNLDDLLTRRPGGVVRHKTDTQPGANMSPEPVTQLPSDTYGLLEYLDGVIKDRTGAANDVAGLDIGSLANLNTGVAAMAMDRVRMKSELIAQILAEIGLRPLFQHVHSLLQKNQDKREVLQLRGQWVQVNPSEWRDRKNVTVHIGIGVASRERKLMGLQDIWEKQQQVVQGGGMGTLITPMNLHATLTDYVEAWGFDSEKYWTDPATVPPPEPPPPDPQLMIAQMMAQVEMQKTEVQRERNQVDLAKAQRDGQISVLELQMKEQQHELQKAIEQIKLDRERLKDERDAATGQAKLSYDAEIAGRDQELKLLTAKLEDARKAAGQKLELYKALLTAGPEALSASGVEVPQLELFGDEDLRDEVLFRTPGAAQAQAEAAAERAAREAREEAKEARREASEAASRAQMETIMGTMTAVLQNLVDSRNEPVTIERDESGRAVSVGGKPIQRDSRGVIDRIG